MKYKYSFPAIFTVDPDSVGVMFPDLPLATEGDTINDALYMAQDALEGRLYLNERDGDTIPAPSDPLKLRDSLAPNQIVVLIEADLDRFRENLRDKPVSKTVTLPLWLADESKKAGLNFSQTLQDALISKLEIIHQIKHRHTEPQEQ